MTWWIVALPALTLGLTLFNLLTWGRGRRRDAPPGRRVSVLVPARDEAANIEACLQTILQAEGPVHEIVVFDDGSTDETPAILARLAAAHPRLRILRGQGLPEGWVGKPHACHRLAEAATGDALLFLDADTRIAPDGVLRLLDLAERHAGDVVTVVPRQVMRGFAERLILPLLHLTYTSWFPLLLTHRSRDPRFLAANGQVLLVSRAAYDRLGGFEAVRREVVDDMAFCRRAKQFGLRVVFGDGFAIARCRMYEDLAGVWAGFSKNVYPGIGGRPFALAVVLALYSAAFLAPLLAVAAGLSGQPAWLLPGLVGLGANLLLRAALCARLDHPLESVLLHPLSILAFFAIALNSWRWASRGAIAWRGRAYAPAGAAPPPAEAPEAEALQGGLH